MTKMTISARSGFRLGAVVLSLLLASSAVLAPDATAERREKPKTKKVQAVGEWAHKRLQTTQEFLAEDKFAEALAELDRMKAKRRLNDHERALMWQFYGFIQSSQEDYKAAAESFEKCLAKDALPESTARSTQYNLGQLYLATEQFDKALKTLLDWYSKTETPSPDAEYTLAVAYVQTQKHAEAIPYLKRAIAASSLPRESWYQLLVSLYFEGKQYKEVAELLEMLVLRFPKKSYWMQLSGIYMEMNLEKKSLAALQMAYSQGFLVEHKELVNLAQFYLYHDLPYRAAGLLEAEMRKGNIEADADVWELLSISWLHAKEYKRAMEPLAEAARMSDNGDLYVKLAQVHLEREDWSKAREALEAAVDKGDLTDPGNAHLLLGVSHYNSGKLSAAERSFLEASNHDRQRKSAKRWIKHIRQEQKYKRAS